MELSREAGWNQTADDWQAFLDLGEVYHIERNGCIAATAAIMPYGGKYAWISMVLTRTEARGQGYGTALMHHCVERTRTAGWSALLDATPLGEPIYRKLGFRPVTAWTRWRGKGRGVSGRKGSPDIAGALTRDAQCFGADRSGLISRFVDRTGFCVGTDDAFCFMRDGDFAHQLGPLGALTEAGALKSFESAISFTGGDILVDVPDNAGLADVLTDFGFERQRPLLRMALGEVPEAVAPWRHYALAGPEFG